MRQGKMDEVQRKVEDSLRKQFGGRIVTLEEAAKDSRAAGQMTKQVQFLTQGPTKIAGSEAEAYRILEVMAKGKGGGSAIKSPEESFKSALKTGDALQERQANALVKIQNLAQRQAELAAISAYNLTRLVAGKEGPFEQQMEMAKLESQKLLSSGEGGKLITGQGIEDGKEVKETIGSFFEHLPQEGRNFQSAVSDLKNHLLEAGKTNGNNNRRVIPQIGSRPVNPGHAIAKTLPKPEEAGLNPNQPRLMPGQGANPSERLDITIHALCQKCMGVIAEEKATKVGRKMLKQNDSNKAMAVQLGHDHGI
jgi:hypothetical protein